MKQRLCERYRELYCVFVQYNEQYIQWMGVTQSGGIAHNAVSISSHGLIVSYSRWP